MRAFTATLATETNTFAPLPTGLSAFHAPGHYFKAGTHPPEPTARSSWMLAAVRERARREGGHEAREHDRRAEHEQERRRSQDDLHAVAADGGEQRLQIGRKGGRIGASPAEHIGE